MHEQRVTGGELSEEVLAAARERADGLAAQPPGKAGGERPSKIAAIEDDALEARARHRRRKTSTQTLDFGQFRHRRSSYQSHHWTGALPRTPAEFSIDNDQMSA